MVIPTGTTLSARQSFRPADDARSSLFQVQAQTAVPRFGMAASEFAFKPGAEIYKTAEELLSAYRRNNKNGWSAFWTMIRDNLSGRGTIRQIGPQTIEHPKSGAHFILKDSSSHVEVPAQPAHDVRLADRRQRVVARAAREDVMRELVDPRRPAPVVLPESRVGDTEIAQVLVTGRMAADVGASSRFRLPDTAARLLSEPLDDMTRVGVVHAGSEPHIVVAPQSLLPPSL
ncbi:MAG: hypothetical protein VKJ04_09380 [Vampirovibrionales bacterium]|nr:hypothetical protein [Vampirovibrionales bacterium]